MILITAIEQAFKGQLAVCVGVALVDQMPAAVKEPEARAGKRGVLVGVALDDLKIPTDGRVLGCDRIGLAVFGHFHGDRGRVQYEAPPCGGFLQRVAAKQEPAEGQRSVHRGVALGHDLPCAVCQREMYTGESCAGFRIGFENRHIPTGKKVRGVYRHRLAVLGHLYRDRGRVQDITGNRRRFLQGVAAKQKPGKSQLAVVGSVALGHDLPGAVRQREVNAAQRRTGFVGLEDRHISACKDVGSSDGHKLAALSDGNRVQGAVQHITGQGCGFSIVVTTKREIRKGDYAAAVCGSATDLLLCVVIQGKRNTWQGVSVLVQLGKLDAAVLRRGLWRDNGHVGLNIGAVRVQNTGHNALLIIGVWLPEKELGRVCAVAAIGGDGEALFSVARGDLDAEPVAAVPAVPGDAGAVRQIVRQAVVAADALTDGGAANEIISVGVLGQGERGRAKADAPGGGGACRLVSRFLDKAEAPVVQILIPIFASDPIAVDVEVEVLGHPFTVVFRAPKTDCVGGGIPGLLVAKAARGHRVAVFKDRIQAGQGALIVVIRSFYGVVAAVIRAVFGSLQAVGHFSRARDPMGGCHHVYPLTL